MIVGILYLLAASLCWSAVFVLPEFLQAFSSIEISLSRFFFFGLISVIILLIKKRKLLSKSYITFWKKALLFGFVSTLATYTATLVCIKYTNSSTAALLFGAVPMIVALIGNFRKREYPFRLFTLPCLAMGIGLLICNLEAFRLQGISLPLFLLGILSGIVAIGFWIWYVIACFDFIKDNAEIDSIDWVVMLGSAVFCLVFVAGACYFVFLDMEKYRSFGSDIRFFTGATFFLGAVSSWCALYFWTGGNSRLPISLVAQIAMFELIFGLTLIYVVKKRVPLAKEAVGIFLMLFGALYGINSLNKFSVKEKS